MKFRLSASLAAIGLFACASAEAQVRRIDGCALRTIVVPLSEPNIRSRELPATCGSVPVIEDAWTMEASCLGDTGNLLESETYQFLQFGPLNLQIVFVLKVKLPISAGPPVSWSPVADFVLLPCNAASAQNPSGEDFAPNAPPPLLLVDDVRFGSIAAGPEYAPAKEFLCAFVLPVSDLSEPFGAFGQLDWFAIVDFDAGGTMFGQPTPDLDGDGCPDSAIELGVSGRFVPHAPMDDVGAGVLTYLLNRRVLGLQSIDVFEPQPRSFVPASLAGMQSGESGASRPWCFTFAIGR
ncbi:MAG: hypothetical protein HY292_03880 [Planctomycetes bacterium]|nr:hypothetical protein [Planctomycetota bacterium]